ncbi:hypothetical protein THAOC_26056 [Thalassiosira oceanica]|uniref:Uncharacterized protein n=1 Tax=Thalassiosira oceanica TaxID=159749 RepID=K0RMH1_THAOC|nr:hypothetical protein THAOC_26056 [Thalassiosira oceanica]|eukprot:EJK54325.1 hypothetical protein THAOC_26056 [Thalassiosira oceanica]
MAELFIDEPLTPSPVTVSLRLRPPTTSSGPAAPPTAARSAGRTGPGWGRRRRADVAPRREPVRGRVRLRLRPGVRRGRRPVERVRRERVAPAVPAAGGVRLRARGVRPDGERQDAHDDGRQGERDAVPPLVGRVGREAGRLRAERDGPAARRRRVQAHEGVPAHRGVHGAVLLRRDLPGEGPGPAQPDEPERAGDEPGGLGRRRLRGRRGARGGQRGVLLRQERRYQPSRAWKCQPDRLVDEDEL